MKYFKRRSVRWKTSPPELLAAPLPHRPVVESLVQAVKRRRSDFEEGESSSAPAQKRLKPNSLLGGSSTAPKWNEGDQLVRIRKPALRQYVYVRKQPKRAVLNVGDQVRSIPANGDTDDDLRSEWSPEMGPIRRPGMSAEPGMWRVYRSYLRHLAAPNAEEQNEGSQ
ncbi:hypothetical protein BDB01DRAFT_259711 [Pilobolus umbonatus]|nr:hypothetical protein BDB01DRAFT_259711 [Pilobolus umbonatus]